MQRQPQYPRAQAYNERQPENQHPSTVGPRSMGEKGPESENEQLELSIVGKIYEHTMASIQTVKLVK